MCPRTMSSISKSTITVAWGGKANEGMKNVMSAVSSMALIIGIALVCCSCSTKPNPEGLAELQKMSAAAQDMGIVISAGVTKDQYSQRLTDALLKFGNSDDKCKQAIASFGKADQQARATEICQRLIEAIDAYTYAKEYFGAGYDPIIPDFPIYTLKEETFSDVKKRFPTLEELPVSEMNQAGYKFYARSAMLQALWKVAGQDSQTAKDLLEKLAQI
jgi:hypothetical protein